MQEFLNSIDEIIKFGEKEFSNKNENELKLEENLIKIYHHSFSLPSVIDDNDYPDFPKEEFENVRKYVCCNFKEYGHYKTFMNILKTNDKKDVLIGDAVDDITDIILDFLEFRWRFDNTSVEDAIWYFELNFRTHTKQHILNILNYINLKNN